MKKIIGLISLILVFSCITGCVFNKRSPRDEIIEYMQEKYDEKFTYIDSFGGNNSNVNILLSSEKLSGYKITASRHIDENGTKYYSDNYIHYKYEEQTRTHLYNIMKEVFNSEIFITYGVGTLGTRNDFTSKTTYNDFIKSKDSNILFNVVVNSNYIIDEVELLNKLKEKINSANISFINFSIYFATSEEDFKEFTELSSSQYETMRKLDVWENFSRVEWK